MPNYTDEHARAGIAAKLPELETWPNQYPGYFITTRFPEYTTQLPSSPIPQAHHVFRSVKLSAGQW